MSTYSLPDLAYDQGALEPHISGKILELHHGKHHAAYVKNANGVLDQLAEVRAKEDWGKVAHLERALAFNLSGHVMHSIFWKNMTPDGGGEPDGALGDQINADFGSFGAFKKHLTQAAMTIMGSGWAALVHEPLSGKLVVTQIYDHQSNVTQAGTPILVIDAWEHAFYLQYQNRKAEFFDAIWNVWNWKDVAARLDAAKQNKVAL